jgi:hypothetical protein
MASLLYTAELDLAEADIRPFLDWYAYRHAPDLVPLGFQSSACYRAVGGDMNLFDIYEIPNHDIFSDPGYRRMNERDGYAPSILAKRRNKAHTIYKQHKLALKGVAAGNRLDADWITVSRFDCPAEVDAVAATLANCVDDLGAAGISAIRLGTRTTDHPVYTTDRPRYMLSLEWQRQPADSGLVERLTQMIGANAPISRKITFDGRRIYPWPDSPTVITAHGVGIAE